MRGRLRIAGLLRLNRRDHNYTSHANQAAEPSVKTCHERATASRASRAMRGACRRPWTPLRARGLSGYRQQADACRRASQRRLIEQSTTRRPRLAIKMIFRTHHFDSALPERIGHPKTSQDMRIDSCHSI
jgi:hypothetical protein